LIKAYLIRNEEILENLWQKTKIRQNKRDVVNKRTLLVFKFLILQKYKFGETFTDEVHPKVLKKNREN